MTETVPIAVLGGGISGLGCAYYLQRNRARFMLFEAAEAVGGKISTRMSDGVQYELGPNSLKNDSPVVQEMIRDLGLEREAVYSSPEAKNRYLFLGGALQKAPGGFFSFLFSPLLSVGSKWAILSEMFRRNQPMQEPESLADFVRRRIGEEALRHVVTPMVSGIYAGDPERMEMRSVFPRFYEYERLHGSVLAGRKADAQRAKGPLRIFSFRRGLTSLVSAVATQCAQSIRCGWQLCGIDVVGEGAFELAFDVAGERRVVRAGSVIFTLPAYECARLLQTRHPELARLLGNIEYSPLVVSHSVFDKRGIGRGLDGFGYLVARGESVRALGCIWSSSVFPERVPAGKILLTGFMGGALDPAVVDLPDEQLRAIIYTEYRQTLNAQLPPEWESIRRYAKALPHYTLGHAARVARIRQLSAAVPGLYITGNFMSGVSVNECVEQAHALVTAAFSPR